MKQTALEAGADEGLHGVAFRHGLSAVIPSEAAAALAAAAEGVPSTRRFCACWGEESRDLLFAVCMLNFDCGVTLEAE